jgi:hypothetical protein
MAKPAYIWDGSSWVSILGPSTTSIDDLSDVVITSPSTNQILQYNGTSWVNATSSGGSASDSFSTISVSGQDNVVADSSTDTLTLVNGTNVSITTNAAADSITINSTGNFTSVDSIVYPDYITFDTTPEASSTETGTMFWDSGDGLPKVILNANVELGLGQEQVALCKNATGSSIPKGSVVYINGAAGQRPTIALSDADTEATSSKTLGLTAETIADTAEGFVTTFGILRGVNTDGLTEGAALWLSSTAGGYTTTIPAEPAHSVFLGYVVKASISAGEIFVSVQNGYELNELHGVQIEADDDIADNEVLAWDDASGLWKNQTASEAGLAVTSGTLAQFASTTSSQLAGVVSDETGTGSLVFATNPTFSTKITIDSAHNNSIEIGRTDGTSSTPFLDFHSGATAVDYDSRILASGGTGSVGGGTISITAATLNTSGDFNINGSSVGSASSTFNLLNTGVTTLNIGGTATAISIGAGTGTTTFNHSIQLNGNLTLGTSDVLVFEGSSDDANETTLTVVNPTADRTITLPDASGTVALTALNLDTATIASGTTTLTISDTTHLGKTIYANNTGTCTVTINNDTTIPVGSQISFVRGGTGALNIADGTAIVNATPGQNLRARYSMATLIKIVDAATDEWILVGDISA